MSQCTSGDEEQKEYYQTEEFDFSLILACVWKAAAEGMLIWNVPEVKVSIFNRNIWERSEPFRETVFLWALICCQKIQHKDRDSTLWNS